MPRLVKKGALYQLEPNLLLLVDVDLRKNNQTTAVVLHAPENVVWNLPIMYTTTMVSSVILLCSA